MSQQPPERNDDQNVLAIAVLFGIVVVLMFLIFAQQPVQQTPPEVALAQTQAAATAEPTVAAVEPEATAVAEVPAAAYTTQQVAAGTQIFNGLCFACHGMNGVGVTGLGKALVDNPFVDESTDDEMVQFLIVGRQPTDPLNTTGQLMPARGGNPSLTDQDLFNVVAYMRALNGAPVGDAPADGHGGMTPPETTTQTVSAPTAPEDWVAPPLNALEAGVTASGTVNTGTLNVIDTTDGGQLYVWYCQACHGPAGAGVDGAAVLVSLALDYEAFAQAIMTAAPPDSPDQTGFVHPYRGGVPGMNDDQIAALVVYLQGLDG